jgi:hypothetical protein
MEDGRLTEPAGGDEVHRFEVGLLEMKPVRGHQVDTVPVRGLDHVLALALGDGQRLLAENMDARLRRHDGEVAVEMVGESDVDRVDLTAGQAFLEGRVRIGTLHPVALPELLELDGIVGDERREFRVALRVRKRRKHRTLSDVAEPDDRVAHLA